MKCVWYYEYPIGVIGIAEADGRITRVFFVGEDGPDNSGVEDQSPSAPSVPPAPRIAIKATVKQRALLDYEKYESPLIQEAAKQLREYFAGTRRVFDLPLSFEGTEFQQKVWAALLAIPYGETRTYGEIAAQAGNPKAARAAGMANNRNPIAIICPCHRVIGSDGSLVGFGGGLPVKKYLLDLERPYYERIT